MPRASAWSLFAFKGIRVQLHWTFPLLIVWVAGTAVMEGMRPALVLQQVAYVLVLFACVVLHEFGHDGCGSTDGCRLRGPLLRHRLSEDQERAGDSRGETGSRMQGQHGEERWLQTEGMAGSALGGAGLGAQTAPRDEEPDRASVGEPLRHQARLTCDAW